MDKYSDHLFSSSSWDVKEKSCWGYSETGQPNVLLPTSLRLHEIDKGNLPLSMINSKQSVECLPTQDTSSIVLDHESNYAADNGFISGEAQSLEEVQNRNYNVSPLLNGGIKMENMGLQYNTAFSTGPTPHSLNLNYSKQLPVVDPSTSTFSFTEASHVECNSSKNLEYHRSFKDMQNLAPLPKFWPSASYEGVSSLSAVIGQDTTQQFDLHEGNLEDDMDFMGKRYASIDQILQLDKLSASVASKDKENLQSYPSSSFKAGSNVTLAANGVPFLPQNTLSPPAGCCNGTAKPRVRARRGQATDPHSIAERLRREKIAERIKNLQELVPNSSKVDKTSILDEIIEYVKFLQLQVKVLSMSRLGAAGAVLPLITDGQAEGSNSLSLSPSAGLAIDTAPSPDQIAFEQEVLKLMESNMTAAVQYLQSKGLCLMPIALATAISSGKASFSPSGSDEKKKISFTNDLANSNNGGSHSSSSSGSCNFSGIETCQMSSDYNIKPEELSSKGIGNGFNGILKLEDVKNQFSRKLKPKTVI